MTRLPFSPRARQQGLSLTELMISLTIGLLISLAALLLYVSQRGSQALNEDLARVQENGRAATDLLQRELRLAGYIGCPSLAELTSLTQVAHPPLLPNLEHAQAIRGVEGGPANPDEVMLYRVSNQALPLRADMSAPSADIPVQASRWDWPVGTLMLISDCLRADVFRLSAATAIGDNALAHATSHNTQAALSAAYGTLAQVAPLLRIRYFVANNAAGNPALFREVNGQAQEVVEHVRDLQLTYGLDDGAGNPARVADGSVDRYVRANEVTDWTQVITVRARILLRSPDANVLTGPPAAFFWDRDEDGNTDLDAATDADLQARRRLHAQTVTIALRNRAALDRN